MMMILHRRTPSNGSSSTGSGISTLLPSEVGTAPPSPLSPSSTASGNRPVAPCCDVEEAAARFDAFRRKLLPAVKALREMHESTIRLNEARRETARHFQTFLADTPLAAVAGEQQAARFPDNRTLDEIFSLDSTPQPASRRALQTPTIAGAGASVCSEATTVQVDNRTASTEGGWMNGVARRVGRLPGGSSSGRRRGNGEVRRVDPGANESGPQDVDAILEEESDEDTKGASVGHVKAGVKETGPQDVDAILGEEEGKYTKGAGMGRIVYADETEKDSSEIGDAGDLSNQKNLSATGVDPKAATKAREKSINSFSKQGSELTENGSEGLEAMEFKDQCEADFDAGKGHHFSAREKDSEHPNDTKEISRKDGFNVPEWESYVAVHEEAFLSSGKEMDRYMLSAIQYIEEWDKIVNTRVQGRIIECRRLKSNLSRYEQKVAVLRAKLSGVESCSSSPTNRRPKVHQRFERNELKLSGAREAYDSYSEGLFLLVEEITERGWMDFFPVLLKVVRFDISHSSANAKIMSRLNGAIGILDELRVRHELCAFGRLDSLRNGRPAELFSGPKRVSHRVRVVNL